MSLDAMEVSILGIISSNGGINPVDLEELAIAGIIDKTQASADFTAALSNLIQNGSIEEVTDATGETIFKAL